MSVHWVGLKMAVGQIQRVDSKLALITLKSIYTTHKHTSVPVIYFIIIEYNMHMNNGMYNRCQILNSQMAP